MAFSQLTSIVPWPHFAVHSPPLKLIQFLWPQGPSPTRMIGLSWQEIRKSRSRVGVGRVRVGWTQFRGGEGLDIVGLVLIKAIGQFVQFDL